MSEKHFDDGSQEYIDQHSNCLQCRRIESERDALKAELENPRHGLKKVTAERDALQTDRDLWKSRAAKYRDVLKKLVESCYEAETLFKQGHRVTILLDEAQEILDEQVSLDAARTKEMERGMMG